MRVCALLSKNKNWWGVYSFVGMGWDSFSEGVTFGVQQGGKEEGKCFSVQDCGLFVKVVGSF